MKCQVLPTRLAQRASCLSLLLCGMLSSLAHDPLIVGIIGVLSQDVLHGIAPLLPISFICRDTRAVKIQQALSLLPYFPEKSFVRARQWRIGGESKQIWQSTGDLSRANPRRVFDAGIIIGYRACMRREACQSISISNPRGKESRWRGNTNSL